MIKGTDLSHWNTKVNYDAMVDDGIRFGCLKLGQGKLPKDIMFDTHRKNFNRLQVPWDFYWFCDYRISGVENVKNLLEKANGDFGYNHPVCDLEFFNPWGRPDGAHMRRFALDFFGELEAKTSLLCMFYSNRDMINQIMYQINQNDKNEFLRHELWLATHAQYGNPSPWDKYKLNQYELDLIVSWSNSTVDLNDFNGNEPEYQEFYDTEIIPPFNPTHDEKVEILWRDAKDAGWNMDK